MATQQTDCEAALKTILSLLNQNNATKGFQGLGVVSPPFALTTGPVPVSLFPDDRALQALIAAYTTPGKAFESTPANESASRILATVLPAILKAAQQEKEYQQRTNPDKGFDFGSIFNTVRDVVSTGTQIAQGISSILSFF